MGSPRRTCQTAAPASQPRWGSTAPTEDAVGLFAIHSDAEAMKWFGADPITEPHQAEQLIELFASWRTSPNPGIRWGIEETATAALIGTCGFFKWNRAWRSCAIGFEMAQSAQGQGLMKEAVYAALRWAFQHMELNRIEALPGSCVKER
eukprot:gene11273-17333_t